MNGKPLSDDDGDFVPKEDAEVFSNNQNTVDNSILITFRYLIYLEDDETKISAPRTL